MSATRGRLAEEQAVRYLTMHGFEILSQNWRTRWCEIDIIAIKDGIVRIVEVKYRRRTDFGSAADFVTYDKKERLMRAAAAWTQAQRYLGPYQIDVITIEGELENTHIELLENVVGF